MRQLLITLTYRDGGPLDVQHLAEFRERWDRWCQGNGFDASLSFFKEEGRNGRQWWLARTIVPRGITVPHLDSAGLWLHGMTQVVSCRRQVAANAAGWFAGLYARWPIRVPPEFPTHSRFSAPDSSFGDGE